jgi:hypothetical protein
MMKWLWTWLVMVAALGADAESVTVSWNANPETNLVGYRVYAGTNSRAYHVCVPVGMVTSLVVQLPHGGRWYFCVSATNSAGLEGAKSAEVVADWPPARPVMNGEPWVVLTPIIERSTNLVSWLSVTGAPTWLPATNAQEFFTTRQLTIERVVRAAPATEQLNNQP